MTDCKTRYYHNFQVQSASSGLAVRRYYTPDMPKYIEVTDHTFVDEELCELIRMELGMNS